VQPRIRREGCSRGQKALEWKTSDRPGAWSLPYGGFTDRLIGQRSASANTIAAYKLPFRLLLTFAAKRTGTPPTRLDIADLDAPLTAAFVDHFERDRA
jgi:hypothetical protein